MRYIFLLFLIIGTCLSLTAQTEATFKKLSDQWIKDFNHKESIVLLEKYLFEDSGLYFEDKMVLGKEKITMALTELKKISGGFVSYKILGAHKQNDSRFFALGQYQSKDANISFSSVIAWQFKEGVWLKELEILYKNREVDNFDLDGIREARNKWVDLSNSHDHVKLVEEVYTPNAIYFNGGRVAFGSAEIIPRYAYMSQPKWKITLTGIQQIPIDNQRVLEVGKYQSSGKGLYVLLWVNNGEEWQAQFDFNF